MKSNPWFMATLLLGGIFSSCFAADLSPSAEAGRRIYEEGKLQDGRDLNAVRGDNLKVTAQAAACVNCHRSSGMGNVEADVQVPPITGRFLLPAKGDRPLATMDPRVGKRMSMARSPYSDDEMLAKSIRTGVTPDGRQLNALMPRFDLSKSDMAALLSYLRSLSVKASQGFDSEARTIRFATVITPGIEPERKQILLQMMKAAVLQKNGSTVVGTASRRHMVSAAEFVLGTENKWLLDVWELTGPPETWAAQLDGYNKLAPPFALVSGISNTTWAPVEDFCERQKVPCWFPSIKGTSDLRTSPKYSFYFSRGLNLESAVVLEDVKPWMASHLRAKLVQVYRGSGAQASAASQLASKVGKPVKAVSVDLDTLSPSQLSESLKKLTSTSNSDDVWMLWLGPEDLAAVSGDMNGLQAKLFGSGTMLAGNVKLPAPASQLKMNLVSPYETEQKREVNISYLHTWLQLRRIPLVDEPLQSEIYFSINFLTDTMAEMLDNLYQDYLVERAENMIGQRETRKAEDEARDQYMVRPRVRAVPMAASIRRPTLAPGNAEHIAGLREGTSVYPRLTLGPGQRFASRGAYIVPTGGDTAHPVSNPRWIVPADDAF
jgi:hypothetical protein